MALKPARTGITPTNALLSKTLLLSRTLLLPKTLLLCSMLLLSGCPRKSEWPPANQPIPYGKCDTIGDYNIRFDRFDETAQQIAHATGCGIITDNSTSAVRPHPVVGIMTMRQAVQMAITGTRLRITHQDAESITVE